MSSAGAATCKAAFGTDSSSYFSMTETELDLVTTTGKLYLGDRDSSTKVDYVSFVGVGYTSGTAGIYVKSNYGSIGEVKFLTTASVFTNTVTAVCSGTMVASADVTSSAGSLSLTSGTTFTTSAALAASQ